MPSYGQTVTLQYVAWDTGANAGKTGDVANHTLKWIKDGTSGSPTNSPAEVDATNAPGIYKLVMTGTEASCQVGTLAGKSSTSGVAILPITVTFENLPIAALNALNGLMTIGTGAGQLTPSGDGGVNVTKVDGVPAKSYDYTFATASNPSTMIKFASTDSASNAVPDNGQFQYGCLIPVSGAAVGMPIFLGAKGTLAYEYNVVVLPGATYIAPAAGDEFILDRSQWISLALLLTQLLLAPRSVDGLSDDQIQFNDALWAAMTIIGQRIVSSSSLTHTLKTPAATTIRTQTLDQVPNPLSAT
jgi:hypothetical protein